MRDKSDKGTDSFICSWPNLLHTHSSPFETFGLASYTANYISNACFAWSWSCIAYDPPIHPNTCSLFTRRNLLTLIRSIYIDMSGEIRTLIVPRISGTTTWLGTASWCCVGIAWSPWFWCYPTLVTSWWTHTHTSSSFVSSSSHSNSEYSLDTFVWFIHNLLGISDKSFASSSYILFLVAVITSD